ncbi:Putative short-chain dehydrogenase/reductase SDR, NAD(P)-binding domain superfamily [Colletotrichum destructivum]|uniref:Short-chain dehydrogenase/reductase SDR, NAD(P)-binding domain superfamily n=1 Tax=Colletotrichum destructivum TaxID=34406 RepID=A0AAX4ILW3_9PEZI|nr:Putative short-chain dehydrogenase/reductase SDR, NAD(P)-binding domain superfamily [Colletotrichum destructivum]
MTETVLIFGASGNMGVSAVIAALRSGRQVIAVVRNKANAEKIYKYAGTREGITVAEADPTSEDSLRALIDQVRAGKLPSFQHVWASCGGIYWETPLLEIESDALREILKVNVESYVYVYRATVPYLLEKGFAGSTWTLCTGAQGDWGHRAGPAITQGALFSLAIAAARETEKTVVRFNEVYLAYRVQVEVDGPDFYGMPLQSSEAFSPLYQKVLDGSDIKGSRISALGPKDVIDLSVKKLF